MAKIKVACFFLGHGVYFPHCKYATGALHSTGPPLDQFSGSAPVFCILLYSITFCSIKTLKHHSSILTRVIAKLYVNETRCH